MTQDFPIYCEYFGFKEKPFSLTPDEEFFFESKSHRDVIDYLRFFLRQRESVALVLGDVGTGKTMTSRKFITGLDTRTYNTALILNPILSELEFMQELMREFRIQFSKGESLRDLYERFQNFLLNEFKNGKMTVCVIDEAQLLPDSTLDFIRVLSNFETDKEKLLHVIFFAQKEFMDRLKDEEMRYLAQRITVATELRPLDEEEVGSYVTYRLYKAGLTRNLRIEKSGSRAIYRYTGGNPRLINLLCDRVLLLLYLRSKDIIDEKVVQEAAKEETLRHLMLPRNGRKVVRLPFIIILLLAIFGLVYAYLPKLNVVFTALLR
ncbi:MAG: AAA family ATPase [Deltaproteobacteria bacterium]|nr:AAA family ATPase [Deltaproteobacteria bacterium]